MGEDRSMKTLVIRYENGSVIKIQCSKIWLNDEGVLDAAECTKITCLPFEHIRSITWEEDDISNAIGGTCLALIACAAAFIIGAFIC